MVGCESILEIGFRKSDNEHICEEIHCYGATSQTGNGFKINLKNTPLKLFGISSKLIPLG